MEKLPEDGRLGWPSSRLTCLPGVGSVAGNTMARKQARSLWADFLAGKDVQAGKTVTPPKATAATPVRTRSLSPAPASLSAVAFRGVVLGVDPSLSGTGLAVVDFTERDHPRLLFSVTLHLKATWTRSMRLGEIARRVGEVIDAHTIDAAAVEESIYVQNFQTAQILGMARGAAIGAIAQRGIEVHDYPPLRIKQAVAGFGRASKEQMQRSVRALLGGEMLASDEADAAAAAICHAFTWRAHLQSGSE